MNEKMKELLEQVGGYGTQALIHPEDVEKFAKLIVLECARVVNIWSEEVPCSEGYDKLTVSKMKEHFGVKE